MAGRSLGVPWPPVTRVLLVRHGQSEWNATGRWQGQADAPLSDLGRRQAEAAAKAVGSVDAIISSDLARAAVTAEIIADRLGVGPVYLDADLRERDAGEWEGLTRAEIHERYPGYLSDDPASNATGPTHERRPPGWESDASLVERGLRALQRAATAVPGGHVLAVTHGGLVMAVERQLGDPAGRLPNLGARWVEVDGSSVALGERVGLIDAGAVTITTPEAI